MTASESALSDFSHMYISSYLNRQHRSRPALSYKGDQSLMYQANRSYILMSILTIPSKYSDLSVWNNPMLLKIYKKVNLKKEACESNRFFSLCLKKIRQCSQRFKILVKLTKYFQFFRKQRWSLNNLIKCTLYYDRKWSSV